MQNKVPKAFLCPGIKPQTNAAGCGHTAGIAIRAKTTAERERSGQSRFPSTEPCGRLRCVMGMAAARPLPQRPARAGRAPASRRAVLRESRTRATAGRSRGHRHAPTPAPRGPLTAGRERHRPGRHRAITRRSPGAARPPRCPPCPRQAFVSGRRETLSRTARPAPSCQSPRPRPRDTKCGV